MDAHINRGWLRVPFDGPSTARLTLSVGDETHRAFYDRDESGAWAQIRVPQGLRGRARILLHADGALISEGRVRQ